MYDAWLCSALKSALIWAPILGLTVGTGCNEGSIAGYTEGIDGAPPVTADRVNLEDELLYALYEVGVEPLETAPTFDEDLLVLGQALAFDPILSGNQDISCMTCHFPSLGTDDDLSLSIGTGGEGLGLDRTHPDDVRIPRNAPALFNLHAFQVMFWDGRVEDHGDGTFSSPAGSAIDSDMEALFTSGSGIAGVQAMFPITSREEMRGEVGESELGDLDDSDFVGIWDALMDRLLAIDEYVALFDAAYPDVTTEDLNFAHAANALGAFELSAFEATQSPFEQFVAGDSTALSTREILGGLEFFEAGCAECHAGPGMTDQSFANTALAQFGPGKGDGDSGTDDFGHERVSGEEADRYAFRVPTLTNVEHTGPYGHVGQYESLLSHVEHYELPLDQLAAYDIEAEVSDSVLYDQEENNRDEVAERIDARMDPDARFNPTLIVSFLESMTDPMVHDLEATIPSSVPSGLPFDGEE